MTKLKHMPPAPPIESGDANLKLVFDSEFRRVPDIMEPYAIRLDGVEDASERREIMRAGLRDTIQARWPLKETQRVS